MALVFVSALSAACAVTLLLTLTAFACRRARSAVHCAGHAVGVGVRTCTCARVPACMHSLGLPTSSLRLPSTSLRCLTWWCLVFHVLCCGGMAACFDGQAPAAAVVRTAGWLQTFLSVVWGLLFLVGVTCLSLTGWDNVCNCFAQHLVCPDCRSPAPPDELLPFA